MGQNLPKSKTMLREKLVLAKVAKVQGTSSLYASC